MRGIAVDWSSKCDTTQYPINQWIVVGEPVVPKNNGATQIQQSHEEINIMDLPSRESDLEIDSL